MSSVEPMRWWHIDAAAALETRLFGGDAWPAEAFWSELAQEDSRYYVVVERDGALVAYAGLLAVPGGPDADVMTLAVDPSAQGHGLGGLVLRDLLAEAARRGCASVFLEVRAGNESALALYRRHGFERVSVRRRYYADGDDALVMRRRNRKDAEQ